jgi:hypothetical protein
VLDVMKEALLGLLGSKKAWTVVLALGTLGGAKLGLEVDAPTFWAIAGLFIALVGAQGLTDHGKESAKINASYTVRPTGGATPVDDDPLADPPTAPTIRAIPDKPGAP